MRPSSPDVRRSLRRACSFCGSGKEAGEGTGGADAAGAAAVAAPIARPGQLDFRYTCEDTITISEKHHLHHVTEGNRAGGAGVGSFGGRRKIYQKKYMDTVIIIVIVIAIITSG